MPLTAAVPSSSGRTPPRVPISEGRRRRFFIHTVALVTVMTTTVYLLWRAAETLDMSVWWLAIPLLALEVHALISMLLFMPSLWDLDAVQPPEPVDDTDLRLAVLVPTYNEPVEVLLPAVAAAVSITLPHETWVLDDGGRPEVESLALALGARYLARPDRGHAKAGNVNYALERIGADVVAILDADHVADLDLLRHTLGYFEDPEVALVQTPQDFYNVDSFEHHERRTRRRWPWASGDRGGHAERFSEQELFYRALQPGRNRFNAAFCCGTGAVLRTAALKDVGGLATETVTEDIHTTIRLHRAGWKTRYHNEVLARGLAAADAAQYLVQRVRWGTGAMQVLRCDNPAYVSGLTVMQRVSYMSTLLGWFDAWRSLGYLLVPMLVLVTGAVPVRADAATFAAAFITVFLLQRWALHALCRGMAPQGISTVFDLVRMPATLLATTRLLSRRERPFTVTNKGRTGKRRARMQVPRLLTGLLVASLLCAGWFVATMLGLTPTVYRVPWAVNASFGWLLMNSLLLALAVRRIRHDRFAGERRASVRFDVTGTAVVGVHPAMLLDVSLTGALAVLSCSLEEAPATGEVVRLVVDLGSHQEVFATVVQSVRATGASSGSTKATAGAGAGVVVGLELGPRQDPARASLALALFTVASKPRLVAPPQQRTSPAVGRPTSPATSTASAAQGAADA